MKLTIRFSQLDADAVFFLETNVKPYRVTITQCGEETVLTADCSKEAALRIISLASCFEHHELTLRQ